MFLRNYFLESLKRKIPGSFVSHIRYCLIFKFLICATVAGLRRRLADSLFIIPQRVPLVKGFLKISFRRLRLPNPSQNPRASVNAGFAGTFVLWRHRFLWEIHIKSQTVPERIHPVFSPEILHCYILCDIVSSRGEPM